MDIRGLEIVFLLDTSASMNAEDLQPSRLEVARNLVAAVVDALRTDMVSQVNFAGSAYVQCPPTLDYEAFKLLALASAASPDAEQGTDFAKAFTLGLRLFRNSRSSQKVMILVTDGEDQEQGWPEAVRRAAEAEDHRIHRGGRRRRRCAHSRSRRKRPAPRAGKRTRRGTSSSRNWTKRRWRASPPTAAGNTTAWAPLPASPP